MSRFKGDRPLTRSDIVDILMAASAANFDLKNGRILIGEKGKKRRETLPLNMHNFVNEIVGRLQRGWEI